MSKHSNHMHISSSSSRSSSCTLKRFRLMGENQAGTLQLGRKTLPVRVLDMNPMEFTAVVESNLVRLRRLKGLAKLRVMDSEWTVEILSKVLLANGLIQIEMVQVEIAEPTRNSSSSIFAGASTNSLGVRDPLVPMLLATTVLVAVLLVPSLGGRWGTSQRITSGLERTWKTVSSLWSR